MKQSDLHFKRGDLVKALPILGYGKNYKNANLRISESNVCTKVININNCHEK